MQRVVVVLIIFLNLLKASEIYLDEDKLIDLIIKQSPFIKKIKLQKEIYNNQIEFEKMLTTPNFYSTVTYSDIDEPNGISEKMSDGFLNRNQEKRLESVIGVKGILSSGLEWDLSISKNKKKSNLIEKYEDYNAEYQNNLSLNLKQPLLKNFGKNNILYKYYIKKDDKDIFINSTCKDILKNIQKALINYWKLSVLLNLKESYEKALVLDKNILDIVKQRIKQGDMNRIDFLKVKSSILSKMIEIKNIENKILKIKNEILNIIGKNGDLKVKNNNFNINLFLYTKKFYISNALNYSPEIKTILQKIKKEKKLIAYAKNQLLPELNLIANISSKTLKSSSNNKFYDKYSYKSGLEFKMPLFNKNKKLYKVEMLKLNQLNIEYKSLKKKLKNNIITQVDYLKNMVKKIKNYKKIIKIKEELLQFSRKELKIGEQNIYQIINLEQSILDYKRKFLNAFLNFKIAYVILDTESGILIKRVGCNL